MPRTKGAALPDPVGIALVGTGFAVSTQLPVFRQVTGAEVRALVGRDAARTAEAARRHSVAVATDSLDAVLRRDDIQLVCVTTPPDLHRPMVEAVLAAGKAVLCEKPMALDAAEAESMTAAARHARRLAVVDHELRFSPCFRKLRRLVGDGYLGIPLHVEIRMVIDRWLDPHRPFGWWQERRRGGGVLGALGSHAIDWLRWMFGDIESVCGTLRTCIDARVAPGDLSARRVDSDDYATVWLRFGASRPLQATILLSVVAHRGQELRFEVFGTEGTLMCDEEGRLWGSRRDDVARADSAPLEDLSEAEELRPTLLKSIPDSPFARAFAHLAPALVAAVAADQTRLDDAAGFEDGVAVQRVLDAVRRSDEHGGWIGCGPIPAAGARPRP